MTRIPTTHTGSLPRPDDLARAVVDRELTGRTPEGFEKRLRQAVAETFVRQRTIGLDVVNDGEQGKASYVTYVKDRLTGFDGDPPPPRVLSRLHRDYPDFAERNAERRSQPSARRPTCTGDVRVADPEAVHRDIGNLKAAAGEVEGLFMTAASPGVIAMMLANEHYPNREAYLAALAEAMRHEYHAIVEAGLVLQLDCPDLAAGRGSVFSHLGPDEFRREITRNVEALNHAVCDLPAERMRLHVCWGNYEGPHDHDVPLADILDVVLLAKPAGISLEGCNPRHGHEWEIFRDVALPAGRHLLPGVIDSTTNYVEHPELVAQRLLNYARIVGPERVIASSDCGFGTFAGPGMVAASVAWAKLRSLVEGARIASRRLGR